MDTEKIPVKEKIKDLKESLNIRNLNWSDWEKEFIRNQYDNPQFVSKKQEKVIEKLWERI